MRLLLSLRAGRPNVCVSFAVRRLTALFSHHFPLARTAEAFEFAMSRPPDALKIVVTLP